MIVDSADEDRGKSMHVHVERATMEDMPLVWAIAAQQSDDQATRTQLLAASEARTLFIAKRGFNVLGYAVRELTFFGYPYLSALAADMAEDKQAVAGALLAYLEKTNPADRLFASARATDRDQQAWLTGFGFVRSGEVQHVNPDGETVYIYMKWL